MRTLAGTGVGLALVLVLPGLLVLTAARVRVSVVEALALVPVVSVGALWLGAEVFDVAGLTFGVAAYAVVVVAAAAVAVWRWWTPAETFVVDVEAVPAMAGAPAVARGGRPRRITLGARPGLAGAVALVLLVIGVGIGAATWVRAVEGRATTPPGYDATQHGFYVTRIERSGATAAADVVVSDPRGASEAASYYPLALHGALALAADLTGADAAALLNGTVILMGALVLPCGLYALTRRLVPKAPLAAGFGAVLAALFALFPYKPVAWGGITLIAGVATLPVVLVLLERVVGRRWSISGGILGALTVMAAFAIHNSQIPLLALLVLLLLLEAAWDERSWRMLGSSVLRLAIVGAGALILFAPTLRTFFGGVSERSDFRDSTLVPIDLIVGQLLTLRAYLPTSQGWVMLLGLAGAGVMLWRHRLAWVVGGAVVLGLTILAAVSDSALTGALTFAWYRQPERIAYYLVYFVPVLGGIAVAAACTAVVALTARGPRPRPWVLPAAAAVGLAVIAVVGGYHATRANRALVANAYITNAPVDAGAEAAFDWLGTHAPHDGLVVTDGNIDGAVWMYSFARANPLFAAYPQPDSPFHDQSVRDRDYVHDHITELGRNPRLDRLLRRYKIHYLYYGDRTLAGALHTFTLPALRSTRGLREVYDRNGAHVFRLEPA